MWSSNLRIANRSRAIYHQRLLTRHIWSFVTSSSKVDEAKKDSTSPDETIDAKPSRFSHLKSFMEEPSHYAPENPERYRQQVAQNFKNTPMFTGAVDKFMQSTFGEEAVDLIPQYGLIGARQDSGEALSDDDLVIGNVNMPWSAFICGSQGAGKSHTLCCLLENALATGNTAGALPHPLSGMVMHYDNYSSRTSTQVCEAAYLCSSGIPVNILVSPSNIWAMKEKYSNLPGLPPGSPRPKVMPLYLDEHQLDVSRILKLMAVDPTADKPPLYMEIIMNIIREIAMEGGEFTYSHFRKRIDKTSWLQGQEMPLNLRLQLLDSFIAPSPLTKSPRPAKSTENIWSFEPGSLTIVDLSDPFVSSDEACTLFSICLSIFLENRSKCGHIVAMDEAHKFLTQTGEARTLTNELVSIIRQQRHTGTRVLVATQEPTLSPKLIDLANATFVHRFLSPNWYEVLKGHLAGANTQDPGKRNSLFRKIVSLRTGHALVFCPTAQMDVVSVDGTKQVSPLNDGYINIQIRKRFSADGGKSIMASDPSMNTTTDNNIDTVPMFIPGGAKSSGKITTRRAERKADRKGKAEPETEQQNEYKLQEWEREWQRELEEQVEREEADEEERITNAILEKKTKGERVKGIKDEFQEYVRQAIINARSSFKLHNWKSLSGRPRKEKIRFYKDLDASLYVQEGTVSSNKQLKTVVTDQVDKHLKMWRQKRHEVRELKIHGTRDVSKEDEEFTNLLEDMEYSKPVDNMLVETETESVDESMTKEEREKQQAEVIEMLNNAESGEELEALLKKYEDVMRDYNWEPTEGEESGEKEGEVAKTAEGGDEASSSQKEGEVKEGKEESTTEVAADQESEVTAEEVAADQTANENEEKEQAATEQESESTTEVEEQESDNTVEVTAEQESEVTTEVAAEQDGNEKKAESENEEREEGVAEQKGEEEPKAEADETTTSEPEVEEHDKEEKKKAEQA